MRQLRFSFASGTESPSLPRPYDNLDWEWEIEHGIPLPPIAIETADYMSRELFGIALADWSTQGPELIERLKSELNDGGT